MEKELQIIQKYAKLFNKLEQSDQHLFDYFNNLKDEHIADLLKGFGNIKNESKIQPVNLLRYDLLNQKVDGKIINAETVEAIKKRIIEKDESYFSRYGEKVVQNLRDYPVKSKSPFVNWKRNFSIFFPFLYTDPVKEQTRKSLNKISKGVEKSLNLQNYKTHPVDFNGPQNYGAPYCWIAAFPQNKVSHRNAYQLFIQINANKVTAGILAGWDVNDKSSNTLEDFNTWEEVIEKLRTSKNEVEDKNNTLINYWKYAPGENASHWDEFYQKGIMAIRWDFLPDLSNLSTDELAEALEVEDVSNSNQVLNIENFRDASIGDVIIANKGKSKALGVGVITGEYEYRNDNNEFKHVRKVNWLINHLVQFEKPIFRPDTFSPTLKWEKIKHKYIEEKASLKKVFENIEAGKEMLKPSRALPKDPVNQNFWWLNANPKLWEIGSYELGDQQSYTSHNDKGNKRRIYKYFEEVKPGDLVIGYESSPTKQIKAIFEITEGLHFDENEGEVINFEIKEVVKDPIPWDELKKSKALEQCEVFINNQGSLFKLTSEEFDTIRDLIDERNITIEKEIENANISEYSYLNDPEKPFIEETVFHSIIHSLELKKNIVLQGPPGVGKTFVARKIAYQMLGETDDTKIRMVQFHQSYAYEDFIQGIRPDGKGFIKRHGVFYNFCKLAENNPENKFFFIIDEINRGNLSKIFGELMMLIESDKRGKYYLPLTYSDKDDPLFTVPENLYIIGTMNTADRSLAIVDYALRRRFRFINLLPNFNIKFTEFLENQGITKEFIGEIINKLNSLNKKISDDKNLGPGFVIGHSYFCSYNNQDEYSWFNDIVKYEIEPLLEEYWFDDIDRVRSEVDKLIV